MHMHSQVLLHFGLAGCAACYCFAFCYGVQASYMKFAISAAGLDVFAYPVYSSQTARDVGKGSGDIAILS